MENKIIVPVPVSVYNAEVLCHLGLCINVRLGSVWSSFGDEFLAQGLHLQSHQRCSAGIRTWFYADQSSSSTLTESIIFFLNLALYTEALSC